MAASKTNFSWAVFAAALLAAGVDAHGHLGLPAVTFPDGVDPTQFIATIEASASGFSGSFTGSPADNTAAFTAAFNASDYTSLKDFVTDLGQIVADGADIECGLTDPNETPQPLPETYIEWTHTDTEGFTSSHEGPCEAWCDGTRVFQDDDCAAHFTTAPAQMLYDREACSGASRLTFYWLALHSSTWQVYVNCAALDTNSGDQTSYSVTPSADAQSAAAATPSVTPTATTATPAAATSAESSATKTPSSGSTVASDEDDCDELDIAGSEEDDCEELDIAGDDDDDVAGEADTTGEETEEDCDELDIAGSEDCDELDIAGSEDCEELDIAGSEDATPVSASSLNFDDLNSDYNGGEVSPEQSY